jgi:hypothetical protein
MSPALAAAGLLLALTLSAAAQPPGPRLIVVTQEYALDAGFGAVGGEHVLRFPVPDPARVAALRPGERLSVVSASVTGSTRMSVDEGEHHWSRTYSVDARRDRGATLTLTRTRAGIELSTALYLEDRPFTDSDPRDANDPQSLRGACRFVFEQGTSFLVAAWDASGPGPLVAGYQGQGEWNDRRRCRGAVRATLEAEAVKRPAPEPGATAPSSSGR